MSAARVVAVCKLLGTVMDDLAATPATQRSRSEAALLQLFDQHVDDIAQLVELASEEMGAAVVRSLQSAEGAS
jgi:hypothetical protein